MKQIIIGREGNQPFTINDEYVSRQHAIFAYDEITGAMTLKDRSSAGTFIKMGSHFQQISQCNVDATTVIRLGPFYTFRIGQLFQAPEKKQPIAPQKPPVEKVDIAYLRKVAENYEDTRLKLEQKQASINSLRNLGSLGLMSSAAITALVPKLIVKEGDSVPIYVICIGPVVAILFVLFLQYYCSKESKEIITKKNKNDKTYKISFCCPKCHVPFAGKLYENILAEGKCPKCKVEFYDSKI